MKRLLSSVLVIALSLWLYACLTPVMAHAAQETQRKLTVAIGEDYPPFNALDDHGRPWGLLVDIWRLWSAKTGVKVKFVPAPFGKTLRMVGSGQVDVHGGCFRNQQRAEYLDFVAPVLESDVNFFFHKGIFGIRNLLDLRPYRIGVIKGDFVVGLLKKRLPDASLVEFDTYDQMFEDLKAGEIRVFVADTPVGVYYLKKWNLISDYRFFPDQPLHTADLMAAVKKGNHKLQRLVKRGLDLITPAERVAIERRWSGESRQRKKGVLIVAAERNRPPLSSLSASGRPSGILPDIWRLWAAKTGSRIEFVFGSKSEIIDWVRGGRADIICGLVREPYMDFWLDFSQPLFPVGTGLFYRVQDGPVAPSDLAGKSVGVLKDSFVIGLLANRQAGITFEQISGLDRLVRALYQGEVRAVAGVNLVINEALDRMGYSGDIARDARELSVQSLVAGTGKDRPRLLKLVNKGMAAISRDEMLAIEKRWVADETMQHIADTGKKLQLSEAEKKWLAGLKAPVVAGAEMDWPPFDFVKDNEPTGYSNELLRLAAQKAGLPLKIIYGFRWTELLDKFRKGEIDILPAVYETPERMREMSFTKSYAANPTVLVVQDGSSGIDSLETLAGKKLAVVDGFSITRLLMEKHPLIKQVPVKNVLEGLKAVSLKKVDAFIGSLGVISYLLNEQYVPGVRIIDEVIIDKPEATHLYMATLKDRAILSGILQKGLDAVSPRDLQRLKRLWLPISIGESKATRELVLSARDKEWLAKHPDIVLGVNPDRMPIEGINSEGVYQGVASGFSELLARKLGVSLRPASDLSWPQVMAKVSRGQVDLLPAITRTPQRERYLLFTRSYLNLPVVVVTRDDAPVMVRLKDLKGKPIAVADGDAVIDMIKKDHPGLLLKPVESVEQGLTRVAGGDAYACVGDMASINYNLKKLGLKKLKISATTKYNVKLSMAVRKDWPEFADIVQRALDSISGEEKATITSQWVNIRFAKRMDWGLILSIGGTAAGVIAIVLAVIIIWNRRLASQVRLRQEAEERFLTMAANVPGAIFQFTAHKSGEARFTYLSQRAEEFFGVPPEVVLAEKRLLHFHPLDKDRAITEINKSLEHESKLNLVARILMPDGQTGWVRLSASPTRISKDELAFNGFILNITERKQAEMEFIASERKVKAMSQAVDDALIMIDGQGKVVFWNPAAERLFGYSAEEAMGMAFHDMAAPEEYKDRVGPGLKRFAETGEGPVLGTTTEITARNRAGDHFPVEVTLSSFLLEGQWYAVGTVRDITERKRAEQAIRDSERRMADVIDFLPDPTLVIDAEGKVLFWNRSMERITGVKKEDMIGKGDHEYSLPFYGDRQPLLVDLVSQWDRDLAAKYDKVKKDDDYIIAETFHPNLGESGLFVSGTAAVLYDSDGKRVGAIETLRDITERKRAESLMVEKKVAEDAAARAEQARREAEAARQEVQAKLEEIERFNRLALGREERIVELKRQANELAGLAGEEKPYDDLSLDAESEKDAWVPEVEGSLVPELDSKQLAEVLSVDQFQKLLQDFCEAAGVAAAIIDTQGKVLAAARWQRICTDFHRQNEETCRRCIESDTKLAAQLDEGKAYAIYRCKNGLTDAASPIILEGKHLANTFVGQFFSAPPDLDFFRRQAREVGFDPERYLEAVAEVPVVDERRLPHILGFLVGMSRLVVTSYNERMRARQAEEAAAVRAKESQRQRAAALSLAEDAEKARAEIESYKGRLELLVAERTEELRASEERSRLLLDSAGEGIFGVDSRGIVTFINPAALAMLGYEEDEIMGQPVHELIHHSLADGTEYPQDRCPMYISFTKGTAHQVVDEVLWRKDGNAFPVEYSSTPISKEGRVMGAVITFRDVSERKAAEKELRRNLDELERFSRLVVGREVKMIALKEEINLLLEQAGQDKKYKIVDQDESQEIEKGA